jgi:hypothetical protein
MKTREEIEQLAVSAKPMVLILSYGGEQAHLLINSIKPNYKTNDT